MKTNSDETVKEVTSRAFKCLPDVKSAINELTKLKAVGPATASGDDWFICYVGSRERWESKSMEGIMTEH